MSERKSLNLDYGHFDANRVIAAHDLMFNDPWAPNKFWNSIEDAVKRAQTFGVDLSSEREKIRADAKAEGGGRQLLLLKSAAEIVTQYVVNLENEDRARRDAESFKARQQAELDKRREQSRIALAERMSKETSASINRLRERLRHSEQRLWGIRSEADLREILIDLGEAVKSFEANLNLEVHESSLREKIEAKRLAA